MTLRHPAERTGGLGRRGWFARLSERGSNFTSSPVFYSLCVLLVAAFVTVHALGASLEWQHVVGDAMAAVTLLLLALLKNAERRADRAIQRKLDGLAEGLLNHLEGRPDQAREALRQVIRMEEEI